MEAGSPIDHVPENAREGKYTKVSGKQMVPEDAN